jgi:NADPH:quinone reductase-like Zn-dependent oxidoreductase
MIGDGRVRPVIGARLPVQQAGDAHQRLVAGTVTGKIVLTLEA